MVLYLKYTAFRSGADSASNNVGSGDFWSVHLPSPFPPVKAVILNIGYKGYPNMVISVVQIKRTPGPPFSFSENVWCPRAFTLYIWTWLVSSSQMLHSNKKNYVFSDHHVRILWMLYKSFQALSIGRLPLLLPRMFKPEVSTFVKITRP